MYRKIVFMSARVAQAWAEGVRPTYTQGDRWIIRLGANSYVTLANGPNLTAEGRRVRDLGWDEPNLTMDLFQTPELRGRSEYLRLRNGAQVLGRIRRGDTWQYTARGREFYSRRVQLVVKIPTIEYGAGGRDWVVNDTFFPVSGSSLPASVPGAPGPLTLPGSDRTGPLPGATPGPWPAQAPGQSRDPIDTQGSRSPGVA